MTAYDKPSRGVLFFPMMLPPGVGDAPSRVNRHPTIVSRNCNDSGEPKLNVTQEVIRLLDEVLSLNGRSSAFTNDTPLLGAIPELDSMAVVSLITGMEDHFGIVVDDDDIDGSTFESVGSLADFVSAKLAA